MDRLKGKLLEIKTFLDLCRQQGKTKLVTIKYDDSLEKAVKLMLQKQYSQLPVVKKDKVIGVISYESITNTLNDLVEKKLSSGSKYRIEDLVEKVQHIFSIEDDVLGLLNQLAEKSYVLVKNGNRVTDIITSFDALQFFRSCSEDFLVLNDIENILRTIIDEMFDPHSFEQATEKIFAYKKKTIKKITDMDFCEYTTFISTNWNRFDDILWDKDIFLNHMENIRLFRNRICHFKCPLEQEEKACLRNVLVWLKNKDENRTRQSLPH